MPARPMLIAHPSGLGKKEMQRRIGGKNPRRAASDFSADSHVLEPGNLWTERVDQRLRDKAPRVEPYNGVPSLIALDLGISRCADRLFGGRPKRRGSDEIHRHRLRGRACRAGIRRSGSRTRKSTVSKVRSFIAAWGCRCSGSTTAAFSKCAFSVTTIGYRSSAPIAPSACLASR